MDKLPNFRYIVLFSCTFLIGLCTAVLPHMVYLWGFFIVSIISSFFASALDTGGNVLCLDTWKDASGPYLHSIHFSFAVCLYHYLQFQPPILKNLHKKGNLCYLHTVFISLRFSKKHFNFKLLNMLNIIQILTLFNK